MSSRTYSVIDSDGHVLEPPDLWERYIDPAYRDRAPVFNTEEGGAEHLQVETAVWSLPQGFGGTGSYGAPRTEGPLPYVSGRRGGFDPDARIVDMDAEGVDASFSFPTLGLFLSGRIQDPGLGAAVCRAYNRWLADYCAVHPDRLFGLAMLPLQSVDLAVAELEYARRELGFGAAFIRANPVDGRYIHDPANDAIWAAAQDLDVSMAIHVGGGVPGLGADRFKAAGVAHVVSHTLEMMAACAGLLMCGICERFPKLRFAFMESGGGWIAGWLDRMDRHYEQESWNDGLISQKPSAIFERQAWISFEPIEGNLAHLADYVGPHKILWATDYPHADGFPGAPDMIRRMEGLSDETKRRILAEGAIRFYNMGDPEKLMG